MGDGLLEYLGLLALSFLAATVLPLSSEVALAALVRAERQVVAPVLVATLGNYLGACTTFWLGRRAGRALATREVTPTPPERTTARLSRTLLRRFGQPALLLSWVPVIGDGLVALAGAVEAPFGAFSFWVVLGKGLRYLAVAWAVQSL